MNTNTTVGPILTEDHIVEAEIPRITEVEIPHIAAVEITEEVLEVHEVEPILTEDHIPEVLEVPPVVEPTLTEEHIVETSEAILEVPVVPLKRIRKTRSAKKVKMEKYSAMPGIRIKRIANSLRLVHIR